MSKTLSSQCRGPGSIPGQETNPCMQQQKIPHAATKTQGSQKNEYFFKKEEETGEGM